ncbi:MAG: colicin uptake protein [Planctomycetaceae bacterium]|nr:colicin uptake protein [Planctomycetaceae bacterium]
MGIPVQSHFLKIALVLVSAAGGATASAAGPVDYEKRIKPILAAHCYACHGALKQESGLRLDTGVLVRKGGESGPVVIPRQPEKSPLLERLRTDDESLRMPPEGKGQPLKPEQVRLLVEWIRQGAVSPDDEAPQADPKAHWAFRAPARQPVDLSAESYNRIDDFVAAGLRKRGVKRLPEASAATLLRRVYLDLVGVPPTMSEQAEFAADTAPGAYERVVDRLLESPRYGERWGRHWMDVWRYSDWYGRRKVPDSLNSYGQIWRWRDWIIRSVNNDKSYDRMIVEMLAADEVAGDDDENLVATGFIIRNFYRWNYNTWLKDNIEHTGKAFLGLTFNCCHCHDHKYDPLTQVDYFRMRATFEPIEVRHDRVPGEADPGVYPKYKYGKPYKPLTVGMVRICDEKLDAQTFVYSKGESRNIIPGRPPISPGGPGFLGGAEWKVEAVQLPPRAWYPGLKDFVRQEARQGVQKELAEKRGVLAFARRLVAEAQAGLISDNGSESARRKLEQARLTLVVDEANMQAAVLKVSAVEARIHADDVRYLGHDGDADQVARQAVRIEHEARVAMARVESARARRAVVAARLALSGKPTDAKLKAAMTAVEKTAATTAAAVTAAEKAREKAIASGASNYTLFSHQYARTSTGRRTALARWIASRDNPLTARVAVNHIWGRHFGRAIVASTENFGNNGDRPTHPGLLDWLAVEFMERGWRMKPIHRLIVTSRTYRTTSRTGSTDHPNFARDPDNISLWRFSPSRMEAEVVRDSVLRISGSLDGRIGGREIPQNRGLTTPRRSVYFDHHGEGRMSFLDLFDAADPCDCYLRTQSVRPQQALAMVNSELSLRQGRLLAGRLAVTPMDDPAFVDAAFRQVLARRPSSAEREASLEFLERQADVFSGAKPSELAVDPKQVPVPPATDHGQRARESLVQALFSHTDFLTIR